MEYLIAYLLLINVFSFFIYRLDKKKSEKGKWRIKESTLLLLSLLGGGIGSMFGMSIYRHKTKKSKFRIGVPVFTIISVIIIWQLSLLLNL